MDLPTSYGTRLLSPFSWRWFAMDRMPIIDVYLLIVLAAGLVWSALAHAGTAPQRAAIALALMAANYGVRGAAHQQALSMAARLFGPSAAAAVRRGRRFGSLLDSWPRPANGRADADCLVDTARCRSFVSPFEWRIIAQLSRRRTRSTDIDAGLERR